MKVSLKRLNDAVHFQASNEEGISIHMDGSPGIGGIGKGVRPMEVVLMGLAGCSSIDVVSLLKKMRQPLEDLKVDVHADRDTDAVPALFTKIHLHYILYGDLKESKVEQALEMSVTKYCSVSKMLEKTAEITYDYEIKEIV